MSVINNLIALPCHAPAIPVCPTSRSVHPAIKIRIHDLEGASEPISPPRKRSPPHAHRLTYSLAQIALDPLQTQNNRQRPKHPNDTTNNRNVAPDYDVFGCHAKRSTLSIRPPVRILNRERPQAVHASWCRCAIDRRLLFVCPHAPTLRRSGLRVKSRCPRPPTREARLESGAAI
jgi:hypothetical protein